jgi:glutamate formiminotransferase/formiminotetrahydrofolate cyclodeaminase
VPFVPLEGVTMADCVALARALGRRIGEELEVPVYLYEHAATRPERRNLADVRRGGFEGLRDLVGVDPAYDPDYGPRRLHATCGAVAVGARDLLVAYNVYLGPASNLPVARAVARAVRGSSGGLRGVKALALEVDGQAQLSMNLVEPDRTAMHLAFELVKHEAAAHGVAVTWSEVVGLVPERAVLAAGARHLQLARFGPHQLLETRLREARGESPGGPVWLEAVAGPSPAPGGGSCAAYGGAMAAALAGMVSALADRAAAPPEADAERGEEAAALRPVGDRAAALRRELQALAEADALAYGAVAAARRLPQRDDAQVARRSAAIAAALVEATRVPRDTARAAAEVADLALDALRRGPRFTASDAHTAVALADAAATAALATVRVNVAALAHHMAHAPAADASGLLAETRAYAVRAAATRAAAERSLDSLLGP